MKAPPRNPFITSNAAKLRYQAVMDLMTSFFQQETLRQKDMLVDLIRRNVAFGGHPLAFTFDNHLHSATTKLPRVRFPDLDSSLHPEARVYVNVKAKLEADRKRMRFSLGVILNRCDNQQDFRNALPEPLVPFLASAKGFERTREAGWMLRETPHLQRDFDALLDIIFYYEANRLVF